MGTVQEKEMTLTPITKGKDEMNLAEFPITLLARRHQENKKTVKFSDIIPGENNKPIKREWIVTGSDEFGLPLAQDNDTWLALLQIGKENGFSSPHIEFSRYRLCKIMGIEPGGDSYRRIERSLDRLAGVYIKAKNAFWDNEKRGYVTIGFGIIENYIFFSPTKDNEKQQANFFLSSVKIDDQIYNSIKNGYIKTLDVNLYFSLKSAISKQLYRYLDKKRYGRKKFEINLFTLAYAHLGFDENTYRYPSDIKKKLNKVHKELIKAGFLRSAEYMPTANMQSEKVVYLFDSSKDLPESSQKEQIARNNTEDDNLKAMLEIGITQVVVEQLLREYPSQRIESQIKFLPFRKSRDKAAVLVRSIQEDWSPPAGYQEHDKKEKLKKIETERQQQEEKEKSEHRGKIEAHIASLSRDELASLTREAKELAQEEGSVLFKGKDLPQYYIKAYLHGLVEKRLGL